MTQIINELSLFMPAYNEQDNIASVVKDADKVLKAVAKEYEILVVNDGSRDDTGKVLDGLRKEFPHLRVATHNPNRGYGGAIKTGFKESRYKSVSFIDSDGQFDYSEIDKFIPLLEKFDLVIGYRLKRQDSLLRSLNAFIWKLWIFMLFGLWVKDIDCAFKLIKKSVLDSIPLTTQSALTSAELLIRARQEGFKIKQVGVHHYPRRAGQQTGANFKVILRAFKESFLLWKSLNTTD